MGGNKIIFKAGLITLENVHSYFFLLKSPLEHIDQCDHEVTLKVKAFNASTM